MQVASALVLATLLACLGTQALPEQAQARLGAENSKLANKLETPCAKSLQSFSRRHEDAVSALPDPQHMLYFLHIPRTAGRTYHSCFLKLGSPPSRRCEKSYDILRIDRSLEGCGLLSSHDDLSASKMFPANAAFATQIRYAAGHCWRSDCLSHLVVPFMQSADLLSHASGKRAGSTSYIAAVIAHSLLTPEKKLTPVQGSCGQGHQRI